MNSIHTFADKLSKIWGYPSSQLTFEARALLKDLVVDSVDEDWVCDLLEKKYPAKELYRSPEHGFVLMSHVEPDGLSSDPHNHGSAWVIYAVLSGKVEMGLFNGILSGDGEYQVIQKDSYIMGPGDCSVYLPGDIHDTRSLEDDSIMIRLTSYDLHEEIKSGRMAYFKNVEKW